MMQVYPNTNDPEVVHARQAEYYLRKAPPETKVRTVEALLQDADVRQRLDWDRRLLPGLHPPTPETRAPLYAMPPERPASELLTPEMDAADALTDLEEAMDVFVRRVAAVLPRVTGMPDPRADPWARAVFMRQLVARSRGALDQIESLLSTGSPTGDIDHFLRDVLASGKEGKG
jgi:hypothetical protein